MKNKKRLLLILLGVFVLLLIYSSFKILLWFKDNYMTNKQLEEIKSKVVVEKVDTINNTEIYCKDDCPKIDMIKVDFNSLKEINDEVVGWIEIPNTNIKYSFVQHNNNSYYLTHSFDRKINDAGWVFLDYRNDRNLNDRNSIIYAHGRVDGTMFGTLKNVFNNDWLSNNDNHVINISTEKFNLLYQIFSVYHIKTTDDYILTNFKNDKEFENFVSKIKNRSIYNFNYTIDNSDKILTLSTCYNNSEKVVVHAKLIARQKKI